MIFKVKNKYLWNKIHLMKTNFGFPISFFLKVDIVIFLFDMAIRKEFFVSLKSGTPQNSEVSKLDSVKKGLTKSLVSESRFPP
jgi:hypothetical protein